MNKDQALARTVIDGADVADSFLSCRAASAPSIAIRLKGLV